MLIFLEVGATIFGLIQGVLVMFNKRSNWIAYIIQMLLLVFFSFSMKLYGDVVNNSIYVVLGVVGFILWNKNDSKKITKCTVKERICYICLICVATFSAYLILKNTNDPLPLLDSFTTVSSLVATYYMMTKKIDTWIIWFINDIFYAIEYYILPEQAFYLFLLNVLWTFMAVASYISWSKIMNENLMATKSKSYKLIFEKQLKRKKRKLKT